MQAQQRREAIQKCKERRQVGGVCRYVHVPSGRFLLFAEPDLAAGQNRFAFMQKTGSCPHLKLQADWKGDGPQAFRLEVMEELACGEGQTAAEFRADLQALLSLWQERSDVRDSYVKWEKP